MMMTAGVVTVTPATEIAPATELFTSTLVTRWLKFLGRSDKTNATYTMATRQMFKYFIANNIARPAREDLENWRDDLIAAGKSPATVQLYLTSCKLFFRFLSLEGLYTNIADHLSNRVKLSHEHKKSALTSTQSAQLIKAVKGNSLKSLRDRAIISLMLSTGLRTIELERANFEDLRIDNGILYLFVQGKGHSAKDSRVKIGAKTYSLILQYLKARGKVADDSPLFASCARRNFGERISTQVIRKTVKFYLRSIGIDSKQYSAHSLRHSAALQMLLNGAELTQVQQVLRHVNLNTTQIYNHSITRMKNNAEILAETAIFGALESLGA